MSDLVARSQLKRMTIEAKVIRADGRVEELGVISDSDKDKSILVRFKRALAAVRRKGVTRG